MHIELMWNRRNSEMFPLNYLNGQVENGDEHGANKRVRAHFRFGVAAAVLDAENAIF